MFDSTWERVRVTVTPGHLRAALMLISLVAMVLGGAADEHWS
jgi:hypothetical protein